MKKNKKGFTLVELLAVIVILGVLLLVAVPAIQTVMRESREKAAKDNALMVIKAFETCSMANEGARCNDSQASDYFEGPTTVEYTGASATTAEKIVIKFNTNYVITVTASAVNTNIDFTTAKTNINSATFTSGSTTLSIGG